MTNNVCVNIPYNDNSDIMHPFSVVVFNLGKI
jgi:hypothetical protein